MLKFDDKTDLENCLNFEKYYAGDIKKIKF